jgi:hypothetical protein
VVSGIHTAENHDFISFDQGSRSSISKVLSSIMRKFIYKSGRTQSAQGREPALDYPITEGREHVKATTRRKLFAIR